MISTALLMLAATSIVRMEVDTDAPATDGTPAFVIGVDNVRRPVVLLSPETYQDMVTQLEKANKSDTGRGIIHGKRVRTEFTDKHTRITYYEDGYGFTETAKPNKPEISEMKSAYEAAMALRERASKARAKRAEDKVKKGAAEVAEAQKRASAALRKAILEKRPDHTMSKRHRQFREALEKSQEKSVTVIHDAVTGKDKVIE